MTINRKYWLRDIPKSENLSISRQVKAYWEAQGHRIVAMGTGNSPLASTSTCVWPEGTPPAETKR